MKKDQNKKRLNKQKNNINQGLIPEIKATLLAHCINKKINMVGKFIGEDILVYQNRVGQIRIQKQKSNDSTDSEQAVETNNSFNQDMDKCNKKSLEEIAQELKQIGNKYYEQKDFYKAIEYYTLAISKNPNDPLYYGNRAQARIRTKQYNFAINDCNRALDLDLTNSKFLYRKALALSGLHYQDQALQIIESLIQLYQLKSKDVFELREKIIDLLKNIDGEYDFAKIYKQIGSLDIDVENFVGPVEIQKIENKGYGIIAQKNIKAGQIIVCSKSFAIIEINENQETFNIAQQLYSKVYHKLKSSKIEAYRFLHLFSGNEEDRNTQNYLIKTHQMANVQIKYNEKLKRIDQIIPQNSDCQMLNQLFGVEIYKHNTKFTHTLDKYLQSCIFQIQANLIRNIIYYNFQIIKNQYWKKSDDDKKNYSDNEDDLDQEICQNQKVRAGIWFLPSFFNHSCIANCIKYYIGDICYIRALKDIKEGEELTIEYVSTFSKQSFKSGYLNNRQQKLQKLWNFKCNCELCHLEQNVLQKQDNIILNRVLNTIKQSSCEVYTNIMSFQMYENIGKCNILNKGEVEVLINKFSELDYFLSNLGLSKRFLPRIFRFYKEIVQLLALSSNQQECQQLNEECFKKMFDIMSADPQSDAYFQLLKDYFQNQLSINKDKKERVSRAFKLWKEAYRKFFGMNEQHFLGIVFEGGQILNENDDQTPSL